MAGGARPVVDDFPGVELDLFHTSDGKDARFTTLLDWYQRGLVVHGRDLPELTEQQLAHPNVAHDDVLDAACAGVEHWLA